VRETPIDLTPMPKTRSTRHGHLEWISLSGTSSQRCLPRVWRVQEFSWYMSSLLHNLPGQDDFGRRLQRAELEWLVSSRSASASLAENYVGLPFA
jgi:hypothetical protein